VHPSCQTLERSRQCEQVVAETGPGFQFRFNSIQMQAAHLQPLPESESLHWSVGERRFALLEQSVNGLRFARLNSQKVGIQRARSPSASSTPVRRQRSTYGEGLACLARFQFASVRYSLRSAAFPLAKSARFGHQRPNPSVEGTAKRLRLSSAPHLAR
jgi:hypothetical protein